MSAAPGPESPLIWVFGYGSLMWRPGFPFAQRRPARLEGWQRAFVRYSHQHRGTPERPGLVAGLREGKSCVGTVYGIAPDQEAGVLATLDEREGGGYLRRRLPVTLLDDHAEAVISWCYVPNREHPSYFGEENREKLVRLVAMGRGKSGTALDYLRQLIAELETLGAREPEMEAVLKEAEHYRKDHGLG